MTHPNTNCPSGWNDTPKELVVELVLDGGVVTQSSSLSVEDHTVRCVVGSESEPTSIDYGVPLAFYGYNHRGQTRFDTAFFDGVDVLYGSPQQHI